MASKPSGRDGISEDEELLNLSDKARKALSDEEPDFVVDHQNWPAFQLFLDCQTQWKYAAGMTIVRLGLDYAQVYAVMQMKRIRNSSHMFDQIRMIERGAMAGLNGIPLTEIV